MDDLRYDPMSAEQRRDPYPIYARLRAEAPVSEVGPDRYAVSRFDDALEILRAPERFSSSPFGDLVKGMDALVLEEGLIADDDLWDEPAETLIGSDPPLHSRLRKIVNRGFTRGRISKLEPRIHEIAEGLMREAPTKGGCEFMADFAAPLPVTVIAELLGVAPELREPFCSGSSAMLLGISGAPTGGDRAAVAAGIHRLSCTIDDLIEKRRAQPRRDLISTLIAAEAEGGALSAREVKSFTMLLLVAGAQTTSHLLGNAMLLLCRRPELACELAARPERIPAAVEELLRWEAPVCSTLRRCVGEQSVAGRRLPDGAVVSVLLASANRDEKHFERPDEFVLERFELPGGGFDPHVHHLSFGFGQHFCLGAALARLEARVALEVLLAEASQFACREPQIEYLPSFIVRGPMRLRLEWRR